MAPDTFSVKDSVPATIPGAQLIFPFHSHQSAQFYHPLSISVSVALPDYFITPKKLLAQVLSGAEVLYLAGDQYGTGSACQAFPFR